MIVTPDTISGFAKFILLEINSIDENVRKEG